MIEVTGVVQHYGVRPVLDGLDLRVEAGELVVLLAPNGTGKSTLLGVMAGVLSLTLERWDGGWRILNGHASMPPQPVEKPSAKE